MWVCTTHMKETLSLLEIPHVSKAAYHVKCSLCDNSAFAKVYYAHQTIQFTKKQKKHSSAKTSSS